MVLFCWMFQIQRMISVGSVASFYSHRTTPLAAAGLLPTSHSPAQPTRGSKEGPSGTGDRAVGQALADMPCPHTPSQGAPPAPPAPQGHQPHSGMRVSPSVFDSLRGLGCYWMPWWHIVQLSSLSGTRERCSAGKMVNRKLFKLCITWCSDSLLKEDNPSQMEIIQRDIIQKIIIVTSPRGWFSLIQCLFFITAITLAPHNLLASCWLYK